MFERLAFPDLKLFGDGDRGGGAPCVVNPSAVDHFVSFIESRLGAV